MPVTEFNAVKLIEHSQRVTSYKKKFTNL